MSKSRARVKVKDAPVTRKQAAAEFSRKKNKLRRKQWKQRIIMIGGIAVLAYGVVGGYMLVHNGKLERLGEVSNTAFWNWTAKAGFKLDQVYLTGREHADAKMVKSALDIKQGAPILALPLGEIKKKLEAIPEVKTVAISRELPNKLAIAITERKPAALWQHQGQRDIIDMEGVTLSSDKYRNVGYLPIVVGDDASKHVSELIALLNSEPSIKPDVVAAIRVGNRRWNVQMRREIIVMLPEDNPQAAWKRFAELVDEKALLAKAVRSIDMRMEDRVFIMPVEENKSPITLTTARDT